MSGSMRGVWNRSYGQAVKAPPDERGGNGYARSNATAPHPYSTIAVDAPMDVQPPEIFDSTLCPSGSHLLRYWDRWRFEKLFSPATARSSDAIRRGASEDLATLGSFTLAALDALPVWQEIETELQPSLGGKWVSTLTDSDCLVFSEIDSATLHGLQTLQTRAGTVDLSRTGQSIFGWLRDT